MFNLYVNKLNYTLHFVLCQVAEEKIWPGGLRFILCIVTYSLCQQLYQTLHDPGLLGRFEIPRSRLELVVDCGSDAI